MRGQSKKYENLRIKRNLSTNHNIWIGSTYFVHFPFCHETQRGEQIDIDSYT